VYAASTPILRSGPNGLPVRGEAKKPDERRGQRRYEDDDQQVPAVERYAADAHRCLERNRISLLGENGPVRHDISQQRQGEEQLA
jgi:hypothetical protein